MPKVSVVMATYKAENTLGEAIESVLYQTFSDFEFIIIDDNSLDSTSEILTKYSNQDSRIKVFRNSSNIGLTRSLNRGLAEAKGSYIARMDSDDICMKNRFDEQVTYLENNKKIGVCGTYVEIFGEKTGVRKHSDNSEELKVRTLFSSQFCHPSTMIRKEILLENGIEYNVSFLVAQDYELWARLIPICDFGTVPKQLLRYRVHDQQISSEKKLLQWQAREKVIKWIWRCIGLPLLDQDIQLHNDLSFFNWNKEPVFIEKTGKYFEALIKANNHSKFFPVHSFQNFLIEYWWQLCSGSANYGKEVFKIFIQNYMGKVASNSKKIRLKAKTLIAG